MRSRNRTFSANSLVQLMRCQQSSDWLLNRLLTQIKQSHEVSTDQGTAPISTLTEDGIQNSMSIATQELVRPRGPISSQLLPLQCLCVQCVAAGFRIPPAAPQASTIVYI